MQYFNVPLYEILAGCQARVFSWWWWVVWRMEERRKVHEWEWRIVFHQDWHHEESGRWESRQASSSPEPPDQERIIKRCWGSNVRRPIKGMKSWKSQHFLQDLLLSWGVKLLQRILSNLTSFTFLYFLMVQLNQKWNGRCKSGTVYGTTISIPK